MNDQLTLKKGPAYGSISAALISPTKAAAAWALSGSANQQCMAARTTESGSNIRALLRSKNQSWESRPSKGSRAVFNVAIFRLRRSANSSRLLNADARRVESGLSEPGSFLMGQIRSLLGTC